MYALREHLDSTIRKRTTSKHINYGKKRLLNDEKDVTMLSETLTHWVPNLWTPYQPFVNLVTGKEAPKEMIVNVKSIKQRGEKIMDGFISRLTFNEGSPAQKTYCDTITKQKSYLSLKISIKMIQLLQEREISLLLKCYHVMTTVLWVCAISWTGLSQTELIQHAQKMARLMKQTENLFFATNFSLCVLWLQ